jgi:deoxyribonuclease V
MIFAFDVAYNENNIAQAAGIGFHHWSDEHPAEVHSEFVIGLEAYTPGEFYKRELPCIEKLLDKIERSQIGLVIIDGFVFLDNDGRPGLGAHVYEVLGGSIPVIGVAKTLFANNTKNVREVLRGESLKPLYVSSIGVDVESAAVNIQNMHGKFRIPTLLKKLDQITKR